MSNIIKYFEESIRLRVERIENSQKEVINSIKKLMSVLSTWSNMDDSYFQNLDNIQQFDKELSECDFIHKAKIFINSTSKSLAYISFENVDSNNIIGTAIGTINTILSKPTFSVWANVSKNPTNNNVATLGKINTSKLLQVSKTLSGNTANSEEKNSFWGKIIGVSDEAKMLLKDFPKRKSYKSRQEYIGAVNEYTGLIQQYIYYNSEEHKIDSSAILISSTLYIMLDYLNMISEQKRLCDVDENIFINESESFFEEFKLHEIFENYLKSQKFVFGNENFGNDKMLKDAYTYVKQELSIIAGGSYVSYIIGEKTLGQLTSSVLESRLSPTKLYEFFAYAYLAKSFEMHFIREKESKDDGLSRNSETNLLGTIEAIIIKAYEQYNGKMLEQGGKKGRKIAEIKKEELLKILDKIKAHKDYEKLEQLKRADFLKWICTFLSLCAPLMPGLPKLALSKIIRDFVFISTNGKPYDEHTIKKELSSKSIMISKWVEQIISNNLGS